MSNKTKYCEYCTSEEGKCNCKKDKQLEDKKKRNKK